MPSEWDVVSQTSAQQDQPWVVVSTTPTGNSWSDIAKRRLMRLAAPGEQGDVGLPGVGTTGEGLRQEGDRLAAAGKEIASGAEQVVSGEGTGRMGGASRVIRGAFSGAGPYLGAVTGVMAPAATAVSIPAGMAVDYGVEAGAKAVGIPEGPAQLIADVAGLLTPIPSVKGLKALKGRSLTDIARGNKARRAAEPVEAMVTEAPAALSPEKVSATLAPDEHISPAVESGAIGEGNPLVEAPTRSGGAGSETAILIPGETGQHQARYTVRELADIQASHSGSTFQPNERYGLSNERNYSDPSNQERVVVNSSEEKFDSRYLITDNPDATNGPPVIRSNGDVIGGNNRVMILERAYGAGGSRGERYRQLLRERAKQFGLDPKQIDEMKNPVLVREVTEEALSRVEGGAQSLVRATNKDGTASLTPAERAIADAKSVQPEVVRYLQSVLEDAGPDSSMREVLASKRGAEIINTLTDSGVFTMQEKPNLIDAKTGALTEAAKDRIDQLMVGRMFRDAEQYQRTPPSTRTKMQKVSADLARLEGEPEWSLLPDIHESVDLLEFARSNGIKNLRDVVAQQGLFDNTPQFSERSLALAELMQGPIDPLRKALKRYAADAEVATNPTQSMFESPSPQEAFASAFVGEGADAANYAPRVKPAEAPPAPHTEVPRKEVIQSEVDERLQSQTEEQPPAPSEHVEPTATEPEVLPRPSSTPPAEPPPAAAAIAESPSPDPLTVSPSYDKTKYKILEKIDVPDEVRSEMARNMEAWEATNPTRKAVTFDDIRVEAAKIDPDLIYRLRRPDVGGTLDPAVRYAARETTNGLNSEIIRRRKALETEPMSADARIEAERELNGMEKQVKQLLDVLLPTRSQDGRNLVYHRMMAERSFDVDYWLSRARRATGLPPGESVSAPVATKIRKILAEGQEAELAATERVRRQRPSPAVDPAVEIKPSPLIARLDAIEQAARARLAERWKSAGNTLSAGPGLAAEIAADFAVIGAVKIARGTVKFANWSSEMMQEFGEEIKPHLQSIWKAAKAQAENDADIKAARAEMRKPGPGKQRPPVTSEQRVERGVARAVKRAENEAAGVEPKPSEWRMTPEEREMVNNDPRVKAARSQLAQVMSKLDRDGWIPTVVALRKAGLLTGVKTHIRNIGGNASMQVLEESSRVPAALVDYALSLKTGRRTVGAPDPLAVAKASIEAATRGMKEAREIWKNGATDEQMAQFDFQRELNSGNRLIDAYVNHTFRILGAEDRVFKIYAYERSLQEQMKLAKVDRPTDAMRAQALADADFTTFNNEGFAAGIGSVIRHAPTTAARIASTRLEKSGQPAAAQSARAAGKVAQAGFDIVLPFVRTPANIIARVLEYSGGGIVKGLSQSAQAVLNKSMTVEQQRSMSMSIGRGLTGIALIYLGWKLAESDLATGTRQEEPGRANVDEAAGRLPSAIKVDGQWRQIGQFSPAGNLIAIGATLQRESSKSLKDEAKRPEHVAKVATRTVMEQPLLQGTRDIVEGLSEPGARARRAIGATAGSFVPTIVNDLAGLADDSRRDSRAETTLESIVKGIQLRLPIARNNLPLRTDVLGRVEPQDKSSTVDPSIGSKALEDSDPVRRELIREQASIGNPPRRKGESEEEHRLRGRLIGLLAQAELERVIKTPTYARAGSIESGDEKRQQILGKAVNAARASVNDLVNHGQFSKLSAERKIEVLTSLIEGKRSGGETYQEFHRRIRQARAARQ